MKGGGREGERRTDLESGRDGGCGGVGVIDGWEGEVVRREWR